MPIRFRFPPPEDAYAGEVAKVTGSLEVASGTRNGFFEVNVRDVSMGEPDLDENVRNNVEFLSGKAFPSARYDFHSITASGDAHADGTRPITLHGDFRMKGITVPLDVSATAIQFRKRNPPDLVLRGGFTLDQLRERFNIMGPGGENSEAGNRLHFEFEFHLVPDPPEPARVNQHGTIPRD